MLVEKEVIAPGSYWYMDETTQKPCRLDVTPDMTRYWHEQGQAMLSAGLNIPVPYEHDFTAHPMTPKEKLLNNAGEIKEYRMKGDVLYSVVDVQDDEAKKKIGKSIRWSSPWISSFTDGAGKQWNNVITHLALTTRPRITRQQPFTSIAAALSLANPVQVVPTVALNSSTGICLSKATRLIRRKSDKLIMPRYPIAFSMASGIALAADDMIPPKKGKPNPAAKPGAAAKPSVEPAPADDSEDGAELDGIEEMDGSEVIPDADPSNDSTIDLEPFNDPAGDVKMEELLCDLLGALGIHCEKTGDESMFKRSLYNAAMTKIHELTGKGMNGGEDPNRTNPPGQPPNTPKPPAPGAKPPNPLIQQEQQPMYMSIEEINKLPEPLKTVALSMYKEMERAQAKATAAEKVVNSLRDAKLREASMQRDQRVALLGKISPKMKVDLDQMLAQPSMALSMGDGGSIVDPMAPTLALLEKGLSDIPLLLTTDSAALSMHPHPTDNGITEEKEDAIADTLSRMMGCPPERKAV